MVVFGCLQLCLVVRRAQIVKALNYGIRNSVLQVVVFQNRHEIRIPADAYFEFCFRTHDGSGTSAQFQAKMCLQDFFIYAYFGLL